MVQPAIVKRILDRDPTVFGEFEYNYGLLLGIKRFAHKNSNIYKLAETLEKKSQLNMRLNLESELRRMVISYYLHTI